MAARKTKRNIWPFGKGQPLGSRSTVYRVKKSTGRRAAPVSAAASAREEKARERERMERKLSDPELQRKLKAHYSRGGTLGEFLAANPGIPGSQFKRCVAAVSEKGSAYDPNAVCAAQGRKKYGAKRYQAMALAGRKRAARNPGDLAKAEKLQAEQRALYAELKGRDTSSAWARTRVKRILAIDRALQKLSYSLAHSNPADAAAAVYEEFHGMPSTKVTEVVDRVHVHGHLAELGRLELLVVAGVDGYEHRISGFKGAMLCANETKDQLFIRGGDQRVNLADFAISKPHEIETLGQVTEVQYFTDKKHLGREGGRALYFHKHKHGPDLIYRRRDKALEFSGGEYEIKAEGIDK